MMETLSATGGVAAARGFRAAGVSAGIKANGMLMVDAVLKRKEDTLKWLAYAYDAHDDDLLLMDREVDLAWLRSDPRFQDLVKRVDLVNRVGWPE